MLISPMRVVGLVVLVCILAPVAVASAQPVDPAARESRAAQLRARGEAYLASGDPGSATAFFRDALQVNPADARSYLLLAQIYQARGATQDALETLSVALRRAPDDAALWGAVADVLVAVGELDQAAEALREQTERTPNDAAAFRRRGELAKRRGAWSEALACYRRVVDLLESTPTSSPVEANEARASVLALSVLAGGTDPVRGVRAGCDHPSAVRRALAGCRPRARVPTAGTAASGEPRR